MMIATSRGERGPKLIGYVEQAFKELRMVKIRDTKIAMDDPE